MKVKVNKTIEISAQHLAEHLINFGFDVISTSKFLFKEYAGIVSLYEIHCDNNESLIVGMSVYSWKGFLRKLMFMDGILKEKEPNAFATIEFKMDKLEIEII